MVTCTECGGAMEPLTKYMAGVWKDDEFDPHLDLFWACEQQPACDAAIRLGSKECVEKFCEQHPEHIEAIVALMSQYEAEYQHKPVS